MHLRYVGEVKLDLGGVIDFDQLSCSRGLSPIRVEGEWNPRRNRIAVQLVWQPNNELPDGVQ